MAIDTRTLHAALGRAAEAARDAEDRLNAADARLGDGDTGETMRRLFTAFETGMPSDSENIGTFFGNLARICAKSTGSSLGTLVTVSMMVLAKNCKGRVTVDWSELSHLLILVRDEMMARGKAGLGDKTVIDMIDAMARATEGCDNPTGMAQQARVCCSETLDLFRERENRIGRARMFAQETIGKDDPGMLAFACLTEALIAPVTAKVANDA